MHTHSASSFLPSSVSSNGWSRSALLGILALAASPALVSVTRADERANVRFSVGVERSMPIVDRPCELRLDGDFAKLAARRDDVEVTFVVSTKHAATGGRARVQKVSTNGNGSPFTGRWVPHQTGPYRISAQVVVPDASRKLEVTSVDVFVTSREMHFNYWQSQPEQRFVTSLLENSPTVDASIAWKRRGVMPLGWKGGQWHWARGYDSSEKISALWNEVQDGRGGIVIDEFGGGDEVDQQMGDALRLTRASRPKDFLAAYCLSVGGKKMTAGFQSADLVLVETYTYDWRWDGFITGRWQTARDAGLAKKSIAVLGIGSQWIGTERELRRVFRMVRNVHPEMPGIGFFPDVPPRLMKAVDRAIADYFLSPVVEVKTEDGVFTVRNIGETSAREIEVAFLDKDGRRVRDNRRITLLHPWQSRSGEVPPRAAAIKVVEAPDRFTVLDDVSPLKASALSAEQAESSRAFRTRVLAGTALDPLQRIAELAIQRTDKNDVASASLPLASSEGRAVALSFDVRPDRCWFYANNSISLVGEGELTLTWSRLDHDVGVAATQPRPSLIFKGKDDYVVRDVPTMGFHQGQTYHVVLAYDGHSSVRAIVSDEKDAILWDSGPFPADGGFTCDRIRFGVAPFKRSEVGHNKRDSTISLRGGGGAGDSPYVLESTVSNLKVVLDSPSR